MNLKHPLRKLLLPAFALSLMVGPLLARAGALRVELGTLAPKNSSYHRVLMAMGQEWREAPDGGIRLKIYPSGVIGSEADMVREMRLGGIQSALLTATGLGEIEPSVGGFQSLPLMFRTMEEFEFVYEKMQPTLEQRLEEKGFIVLFWSDAGWVYFFSKNMLRIPEDLKTMKIFTASSVPETADMWRSEGYQAVALDPTDILTGLQTGMIDTATVPPIYAMATRLDGAAPHMLRLKFAPLLGAAVIQKKAWEQLTPADQKFIRAAAAKASRDIVVKGRAENEESVAAMEKRGLTVTIPTPEIEAQWIQAAGAFHAKLRGNLVPADIFDETMRWLKEYRSGKP